MRGVARFHFAKQQLEVVVVAVVFEQRLSLIAWLIMVEAVGKRMLAASHAACQHRLGWKQRSKA